MVGGGEGGAIEAGVGLGQRLKRRRVNAESGHEAKDEGRENGQRASKKLQCVSALLAPKGPDASRVQLVDEMSSLDARGDQASRSA